MKNCFNRQSRSVCLSHNHARWSCTFYPELICDDQTLACYRSPAIGLPLLLLLTWTCPAGSEPYSPSCGLAVEKVIKARKNLIAYQQLLQVARNRERLAYADLAVCAGGGIFSVGRAVACNQASGRPQRKRRKSLKLKRTIDRKELNSRRPLHTLRTLAS